MINVQFVGRGIKLRPDFKEYAQDKIDNLLKFDPEDASTMFVEVEVIKGGHQKNADTRHDEGAALNLQITFWVENTPIRAEVSGGNIQGIFNVAVERIAEQLEQHDIRERHFSRKSKSKWTKKRK